jgi:penicillin amidase
MKILSWLLALLLLVIILFSGSLYFYLKGSLPNYNGRYQVAVAEPGRIQPGRQ